MKCSNCGFENTNTSKFCQKCGTKLPEKQTPKFCQSCGSEVKQGAMFCAACGKPISAVNKDIQKETTKEENVVEYKGKINKKIVGIVIALAAVATVGVGALWITQGGFGSKEDNTRENEQESEVESETTEETQKTEQIVQQELTEAEYQSLCTGMMEMTSAYGSEYEKMAVNMAQSIVSAQIVTSDAAYCMENITEENRSRLVYALGYSTARSLDEEWGIVDYELKNYRDDLEQSGYKLDESYSIIYKKIEMMKLVQAFYKNITIDQLVNKSYGCYDYDDYIGIMPSDGGPWEYFDAYDIKENDDYILIHAACYTGNNGGGENVYLYTLNALFEKTEDSVLGLQAVYVEGYENNITDHIISITASSELPDYNQKTYKASNLIDGDSSTPWVENAEGVGIGESVQIKLDKETWIQECSILSGYQSSLELFEMNGWANRVSIDFGNGVVKELECSGYFDGYTDDREFKWWDKLSLDKPVYTDTITITILNASAGTKYSDTCISEIELH